MKKIYIIAGEASGDYLGADLIRGLRKRNPDLIIKGIGGPLMKKEGLISLFPMEEISLMGLTEILPHIFRLFKRIKETVQNIIEEKPDALVTIDSSGFCNRVIKRVKAEGKKQNISGVSFFHYVAPTVWAWRPKRAKHLSTLIDHLFCVLPFEPPYFKKYNLKATFVGHPLTTKKVQINNIKNTHDNILILPGSRQGEIKKHLPIFLDVVEKLIKNNDFNNPVKFFIPTLPHFFNFITTHVQEKGLCDFIEMTDDRDLKTTWFENASYAIAKSGTVSLELSKYQIPHVVAYKVNVITAFLLKFMMKTKYVSLINIIAQKEIIPECLQQNCTKEYIYNQFLGIIKRQEMKVALINNFNKLTCPHKNLSAGDMCAEIILYD